MYCPQYQLVMASTKTKYLPTIIATVPSQVIQKIKPKNPAVVEEIESVMKKKKAYCTIDKPNAKVSKAQTTSQYRSHCLDPSHNFSASFWSHILENTRTTKKCFFTRSANTRQDRKTHTGQSQSLE